MSLIDDLVSDTRKAIRRAEDKASARVIEDMINKFERDLYDSNLEKIVLPIAHVHERSTRNMSNDEYDDFISKWSRICANAVLWEVITHNGLKRDLTRSEENDFRDDFEKYDHVCRDYKDDRGGRSDRNEKRRDRDEDRGNKKRRDRNEDNNRHTSRYERDGDDKPDKRDERNNEPKQTQQAPVTLADGEKITSGNFHLLPAIAKDIPFYYAGLEALVYNEDAKKVSIIILDGDPKVNYEKHRTDIYLNPNRELNNVGLSVEEMEKKLTEAALNKIKAFSKEEAAVVENGESSVSNIKISKSSIIDGMYELPETILDREDHVRQEVLDVFENRDVLDKVIGLTISHEISDLRHVDTNSDEYVEFMELVNMLAIESKLADVRSVLKLAASLFSPAEYDVIHRIYNSAVCNAISVSLKMGVRTNSIVRDWSQLETFINGVYADQPNILPVIEMNLCAALPTMFDGENGLRMIRNYIFLPISKNEFTIASPVNYATINQSQRVELYNVINKLLVTNLPQETYKAYTTIVTNDNYVVPVFKNRSLIGDNGYYAFKPI